ncbi:MAG: KTSC domain-containing protein [Clostridia bacterium]|nr:KTSC domain-containing protein [Clostridia bacterium]
MKKGIDGMTFEMTKVESKLISYLGFEEEKQILLIEFIRGPVYIYSEVPKSVYDALLSAEIPDDFFNSSIRYVFKNRRVW